LVIFILPLLFFLVVFSLPLFLFLVIDTRPLFSSVSSAPMRSSYSWPITPFHLPNLFIPSHPHIFLMLIVTHRFLLLLLLPLFLLMFIRNHKLLCNHSQSSTLLPLCHQVSLMFVIPCLQVTQWSSTARNNSQPLSSDQFGHKRTQRELVTGRGG
jgi:quinol-cytochrome oxidoreductase complex cytochrome b subunit